LNDVAREPSHIRQPVDNPSEEPQAAEPQPELIIADNSELPLKKSNAAPDSPRIKEAHDILQELEKSMM
jgi:hypothetical protein